MVKILPVSGDLVLSAVESNEHFLPLQSGFSYPQHCVRTLFEANSFAISYFDLSGAFTEES